MREFFHSVKFKILLCVFALLFGLMVYAAINSGAATLPERIAAAITQPFSHAATAISSWVEGTIDKLVNADRYKLENETLRRQLTEMYDEIVDKDEIVKENELLKQMLELAEENEDFVWAPPCNIIARNANDIFGGFTIDRGSNDGIKLNDPVFTELGLVGVISEIAPTYAKVSTILSTEVRIGARTVKSHTIGLIENDILYAADRLCRMVHIDKESDAAVGDVIMTSGGNMFPPNLLIGEIIEIYPDDNGLSLHAVVKPGVDIFTITNVFVITHFKGQGVTTE